MTEIQDKIEEAEQKLETAQLLQDNQKYEDAVSRAYYSMFHAAKAVLILEDSRPKTHAGTASELGKLFRERIDPELIADFSRLQQLREDADYEASNYIDEETGEDAICSAEKFLNAVKQLVEEHQ